MRGWKRLLSEDILVQLHSGKAFRGVLWDRSGDFLVLRGAELFEPGLDPVPVDGEVVIHRAEVEYFQIPKGG